MKVHVKTDSVKEFNPFTVEITITTREEAIHFHDNVMTVLNPDVGSSPLYGAIYSATDEREVDECFEI